MTKPLPFLGTPEEGQANFRTHSFNGIDFRCYDCDSRPFSTSSFYPCGAPVPRVEVK